MERLQPRNEKQDTGLTRASKLLLKLALWSFVVAMGILGLFFAVNWSIPQETQVDLTQQAYVLSDPEASVQVTVVGAYAHYRLGNRTDSFSGYVKLEGKNYQVTVEYALGREYGCYRVGGSDGFSLLLSRDQKTLMLQDAQDNIYIVQADRAGVEDLRQLLEENPDWAEGFDLE